jgi:adenylate cyclase
VDRAVASFRFRGNIRPVTTKLKRRLTTVLCADVHGYSRLMEADESGTLAALRRCRAAIAMLVARHDGRVVNTWGDAVIAEFASVVEAVQCAVEIQQELSNPSQECGEDQRMRFRIGINLGDVMVEETDLYGEGVNIAARLQELAEPGGILISGPVYDQVHRKMSVGFEFLGQQQVKNVTQAVMGYRVTLKPGADAGAAPSLLAEPAKPAPLRSDRGPQGGITKAWEQYMSLPRPIAAMLAISVFLFLINAFSGFHSVWFHWPVASLLLIVLLWAVLRRDRR